MHKCLVTGGAGFIGSHVAEALVRRGDCVTVLDNFSTGWRANLAKIENDIRLVEGDINDSATLRTAIAEAETVFHLAALPSVARSIADPTASNHSNVDGTVALLWAAKEARVRRVVYSASSSAYGNSPQFPRIETIAPEPLSPYAASKVAGEYFCRAFTECYGLETVSLRYFNIFGPRQDPKSQYAAAIPLFITAIMANRAPIIYGDGEQSRDFTYIANAVQANLLAADAPEASGKVFNIAFGKSIAVNQVLREINQILEKNVSAKFDPPRYGEVRHSHADISLAKKYLGYEPIVSFQQGLLRTVQYFSQLYA